MTFPNTHILVPEFDYLEPETIEEAAEMAAEPDTLVMAGGTDLLVQMKLEHRNPSRVVSLQGIESLRRLDDTRGLELGATATIRDVGMAPAVRARYAALAEACHAFSTVQIMVMGTVGGNLCNASPAADTAPALLVFDARVRLVSGSRTREVSLDVFFVGPGQTVMEDGELLESIHMPEQPNSAGSAFLKMARVTADISKVSVAVSLVRDGAKIAACRVALGSVAATPRRSPQAEGALTGNVMNSRAIDEAVRLAREDIAPITDVRSTADYRRQVAGVLVGDAIRSAWTRAGGGDVG
jgi:carbon-monoxide dehydrogenase medium subunit